MAGQPAEDDAEDSALAQAAADIAGEEQELHGGISVLGIGADKAGDDLLIAHATESADGGEQIEAVGACGGVGHGSVFGVGDIRLVLQIL